MAEEEITPKEHTWLVLKHGTDYLYRLGRMSQPKKQGGSGMKFAGVEAKAAKLGLEVVDEREKAFIKGIEEYIASEIKTEIDNEILRTIQGEAGDN